MSQEADELLAWSDQLAGLLRGGGALLRTLVEDRVLLHLAVERRPIEAEDLQQEVVRFQGTIEQVGRVANEGMRVVQEFNAARVQSQFPGDSTAH